jgi:hypothetical protein
MILWLAGLQKGTSGVEPSQERAGLFLADVAVVHRAVNNKNGWRHHAAVFRSKQE